MKRIVSAVLICAFLILTGCSNRDRTSLANWMHNLDGEKTQAFFWSADTGEEENGEIALTADEKLELLSILDNITEDCITWNKRLGGITPEYGLHLVVEGDDYYINQADAPRGQTEIRYREKQWWIKSSELQDFMLSLPGVS